jgi:hypothetical protein
MEYRTMKKVQENSVNLVFVVLDELKELAFSLSKVGTSWQFCRAEFCCCLSAVYITVVSQT